MNRRPTSIWPWPPSRTGALAALSLLLLTPTPGRAAPGELDCRYDADGSFDWSAATPSLLETADPFRPLLAAPKEGRPAGTAARIRMSGDGLAPEGRTLEAGIAAIGGAMGLWGIYSATSCSGIQVGLSAAVFAEFNLGADSKDLLNADYDVALPVSVRHGPLSARVRLMHESSHLGDQFVLATPGVRRIDLSHELVDLVLSYEHGFARVYGGGGYIIHSKTDLRPASVQGGVELRGPTVELRFWGSPIMVGVAGVDVGLREQRAWQSSTNVVAGIELHQPGAETRLRVLAVYQHGYWPFGQFSFTETVDGFGLQTQFEL